MNLTPYEDDEQSTLVEWLEIKKLKFTSIPNSTWTPSFKQLAKNKRNGLRDGLCDLLIIIPKERSLNGEACLIFCELKRRKGGRATIHQLGWIDALNEVRNVEAFISMGCDDAIDYISSFLK